jgi:hypothetical protein
MAWASSGSEGREQQAKEFDHVHGLANLLSRGVLPPLNASVIVYDPRVRGAWLPTGRRLRATRSATTTVAIDHYLAGQWRWHGHCSAVHAYGPLGEGSCLCADLDGAVADRCGRLEQVHGPSAPQGTAVACCLPAPRAAKSAYAGQACPVCLAA